MSTITSKNIVIIDTYYVLKIIVCDFRHFYILVNGLVVWSSDNIALIYYYICKYYVLSGYYIRR